MELVAVGEIAIPGVSGNFERMFRARSGLVFRTAYRLTGNASDAEDVLQNVFLRLLRRGADGPAIENEESYFRRAAINVALDVLRSRSDERSVPLDELASEPSGPAHSGVSELRGRLRQALSRLKPREAEVFTLRFLEDYSNPEIARMLGISRVLVAVIVHRVRRQLQKEII